MATGTFIKEWYAAWNTHDSDKIIPFYTDNCVYEDMGPGRVFHGKQELISFIKGLGSLQLKLLEP